MLIDIVINSLHQVMEFLRKDLKCNFCDRFQHQMHSLDGSIGQPWTEDLLFAKLLGLYSYFHSNQTWPFIFYTAYSTVQNCNNHIHTKYEAPASIFMTVIIAVLAIYKSNIQNTKSVLKLYLVEMFPWWAIMLWK